MSKFTRTLALSLPTIGLLAVACQPVEPPKVLFDLAAGTYRMTVDEINTMECRGDLGFDDDIFDQVFFAQIRGNSEGRGYTMSLEGIDLTGGRQNNKLSLSWNAHDTPVVVDDDVDIDEDDTADAPRMMTTMPDQDPRPIRDFPDVGALLNINADNRLAGSLFIEEDQRDSFCTIELGVTLVHIDGGTEVDPHEIEVYDVDTEYED